MRPNLKSLSLLVLASAVSSASGPISAAEPFNLGYVEFNEKSTNQLSNIGCFKQLPSGKPFFTHAAVFAANVKDDAQGGPRIHYNAKTVELLDHSTQVPDLQRQGIKVLLSILGGSAKNGWTCYSQAPAAAQLADRIAVEVQRYGFDGIDIDEEYTACPAQSASLTLVAAALKAHPLFAGKWLTKALFRDERYFSTAAGGTTLGRLLDRAWEMSYWAPDAGSRLNGYLQLGLDKDRLGLGIDLGRPDALMAAQARSAKAWGAGGLMLYNVMKSSQPALSTVAMVQSGQTVVADPACLR